MIGIFPRIKEKITSIAMELFRQVAFIFLFSFILGILVIFISTIVTILESYGFDYLSPVELSLSGKQMFYGGLLLLSGVFLSATIEFIIENCVLFENKLDRVLRWGWVLATLEEDSSIPESKAQKNMERLYNSLMRKQLLELPSYFILPASLLYIYFGAIKPNQLGILYIGEGTILMSLGTAVAGAQTQLNETSKREQRIGEVISSQVGVLIIILGSFFQFLSNYDVSAFYIIRLVTWTFVVLLSAIISFSVAESVID